MITMSRIKFIETLHSGLRRLYATKGGNVTLTFAIATIPLVGFVGAAMDYSRANSAKAAMQVALDSSALMLAKEAYSLTTAQLDTKATDYFKSLFTRTDVANATVTPTYTTSNGS